MFNNGLEDTGSNAFFLIPAIVFHGDIVASQSIHQHNMFIALLPLYLKGRPVLLV
jgi:hypothetical protein